MSHAVEKLFMWITPIVVISISEYWQTAVAKAMAVEGVLDVFIFLNVPLVLNSMLQIPNSKVEQLVFVPGI